MGIKTEEVSYGFGQMGSAITDSTSASLYPPKGMVIVAITSLHDQTAFDALGGLVSEVITDASGTSQSPYITTEVAAHDTGQFQLTGCDGTGSLSTTLTGFTASTNIKLGQIIESTTLTRSLTDPYRVATYTAGATSLTMNKQANIGASANETVTFFEDHGQGYGGVEMDTDDLILTGTTIYGRWTAVNLDNGRAICYFGY